MNKCTLCPVSCGADRNTRAGKCGVKGLTVAKYYLHPFEEPPISHKNGSGTVFFGGCSLRCAFCQNYDVSRANRGKEITPKELAEIFRKLENMGAENINLVTPDHVSHLIAEALTLYRPRVPVVYNSSGYCKTEALEQIAPYVDIWLPDFKFYSPALAERYTGRKDYFDYASQAIPFMAQKPVVFREDGKMLGDHCAAFGAAHERRRLEERALLSARRARRGYSPFPHAAIRAYGRGGALSRAYAQDQRAGICARRRSRPFAGIYQRLYAEKRERGRFVCARMGLLIICA